MAAVDDSIKTVFTEPVNYNVVHPLQNEWTLWYDNPNKKTSQQNWTQNLKELVTVRTVEDFWSVINSTSMVNEIPLGSNYHLFKKGIKPMWEDKANEKGGKWSCTFNRNNADTINDVWINAILALIGENYDSDEICGIVFSNRKVCFRIGLWIKSHSNRPECDKIGAKFKSSMGSAAEKFDYQPHNKGA
ncbi:hypothetical protein BB559_001860 [Furculomyces boomerangus]|uniref:Eukaryotic translation initiation factor 4E n=2 Tax=Harpellales TaxID=61421 RepID=A0A2T9YZY8_9FUNG|nr:hypothetical protein BB559_001860 [Furculomyces boomerangus]PWA03480.1 hypothetical protein BB558_000348 [Smittium angustum]